MTGKRCVLAGGSGFLGTFLTRELEMKGYEVLILTRKPKTSSGPARQIGWDGKTLGAWVTELEAAEAVVNLVGKSVNCRYTPENREEIVRSRVDSVHAIGQAILKCKTPPKTWVQCGSVAIYGDAGARACDEDSPIGEGFSANTCRLWEQAFNAIETAATRKVFLRISFALAPNDGALGTLVKLVKCYLGGTVGNGRQYISWLHRQDLMNMILDSIERTDIQGVFNATSPNPVSNAVFMRALRSALKRPWSPPVPEWAVHIGARLMGTEPELALTSRYCAPKRFQERGFTFQYPLLSDALNNIFA